MSELVSVIIPAFNAEKTIARAVDSVLAQDDVAAIEVIVVNDGSIDGTKTFCEAYGERIRYIEQENRGVSAARNRGIAAASGEFIGFLDADDELTPSYLSTFKEALSLFPESKAFCGAYVKEAKGVLTRCVPSDFLGKRVFGSVDLIRAFAENNYLLNTDTAIVHRSVFPEVGCFIEGMTLGEDIELWTRIAGRFTWCFMNRVTAIYHDVDQSATKAKPVWAHGVDFIYDEKKMQKLISEDLWFSYRIFRRNLCAARAWGCFKMREYDAARKIAGKIFPARLSLRYATVLAGSICPDFFLNIIFWTIERMRNER